MDVEWKNGPYGDGWLPPPVAVLQRGKSLNAAKKFCPGNHLSPAAAATALCFCLILSPFSLPSFLSLLAWQMTDGGGNQKEKGTRKGQIRSGLRINLIFPPQNSALLLAKGQPNSNKGK